MRIMITGSRVLEYSADNFKNMWELESAIADWLRPLDLWNDEYGMPSGLVEILVGDCPSGADLIAREWAINNFVVFREFKADWREHGPAAGPLRNRAMVAEKPDVCLAFPLVLDSWSGTMQAMFTADKAGIPVYVKGERWTRADYPGTIPKYMQED